MQDSQIGYEDITDIDILTLINEKYTDSENQYLRENFLHDYFIQISLCVINGMCYKADSTKPIANIFVKLQHIDKSTGELLINKKQLILVGILHGLIKNHVNQFSRKREALRELGSQTFLPYYDTILNAEEKKQIGEAKVSDLIISRVKQEALEVTKEAENTTLNKRQKDHDHALLKFVPEKSEPS
jgi:hypothetical protein